MCAEVSFGLLDVPHVAHPAFLVSASYGVFLLNDRYEIDPLLAGLLITPLFFMIGLVAYRLYYETFEKRGSDAGVRGIAFFFGTAFIIEVLIIMQFGVDQRRARLVEGAVVAVHQPAEVVDAVPVGGAQREAARVDPRQAGRVRAGVGRVDVAAEVVGVSVARADGLGDQAAGGQRGQRPSRVDERPGVAGEGGGVARHRDDPGRLDQLLALPRAHLVVDGYNVTKRGFGDLPLERQRSRLVTELSGLAGQTGAEVTVAFDGAERVHGLPPTPRSVRVLFSRKGQTADDLIRRLVRAEPDGRPVVVVSSDREVADSVRRSGAYPVSSDALLRRLARS